MSSHTTNQQRRRSSSRRRGSNRFVAPHNFHRDLPKQQKALYYSHQNRAGLEWAIDAIRSGEATLEQEQLVLFISICNPSRLPADILVWVEETNNPANERWLLPDQRGDLRPVLINKQGAR